MKKKVTRKSKKKLKIQKKNPRLGDPKRKSCICVLCSFCILISLKEKKYLDYLRIYGSIYKIKCFASIIS